MLCDETQSWLVFWMRLAEELQGTAGIYAGCADFPHPICILSLGSWRGLMEQVRGRAEGLVW